jgi:hypothetical protein
MPIEISKSPPPRESTRVGLERQKILRIVSGKASMKKRQEKRSGIMMSEVPSPPMGRRLGTRMRGDLGRGPEPSPIKDKS